MGGKGAQLPKGGANFIVLKGASTFFLVVKVT